ncbi:MAG: bactofilin family protein [Candidatus Acidiferrales bacterium]
MWRKPTEDKPVSNASPVPASAPISSEIKTASPTTASASPVSAPPAAQAKPQPAAVTTPSSYPAFSKPAASTTGGASSQFSSGLKIRGDISGSGDLFIDGEAQGKITLPGAKVTIGPNGRVQADIEAREIIIQGSVQGNLKAGELVSLGGASHVQGSMLTPRIAMEDGARLRGKVEMTRVGETKPPTAIAAAARAGTSQSLSAQAEKA